MKTILLFQDPAEVHKSLCLWAYLLFFISCFLPAIGTNDRAMGYHCVLYGFLMIFIPDGILAGIWWSAPNVILLLSGTCISSIQSWTWVILLLFFSLSSVAYWAVTQDGGYLHSGYWIWAFSHVLIWSALLRAVHLNKRHRHTRGMFPAFHTVT